MVFFFQIYAQTLPVDVSVLTHCTVDLLTPSKEVTVISNDTHQRLEQTKTNDLTGNNPERVK